MLCCELVLREAFTPHAKLQLVLQLQLGETIYEPLYPGGCSGSLVVEGADMQGAGHAAPSPSYLPGPAGAASSSV
jgi:hypothetical protein